MNMKTSLVNQRVDCRFCSIFSGADDAFDSVWLSENGYHAMVSIGTLVPGWSLVCPTRHEVNLRSAYSDEDFWTFATMAAKVMESLYGPVALFEHGATCEDSLTGCGVGHAHAHLVPLKFSLEVEARKFAPELSWEKCAASSISALSAGQEYLFVASTFDGANTSGSLCILEESRSQFFRRLIAEQIGRGDLFDYKTHRMLDIASASAEKLRDQVNSILVGV